jgi:hypothetical protein
MNPVWVNIRPGFRKSNQRICDHTNMDTRAQAAGETAEAVRASRRALELLANDKTLPEASRSAIHTASTDRIQRLGR